MAIKSHEKRDIRNEEDIVNARASIKRIVALLNFSLVSQTKVVTAASELARNTLEHGKGGDVDIQVLEDGARVGIRIEFEDKGGGIENVAKAMEDGYTTGKGMGLGLGGAKRLMDEFELESKVNEGTRISITKWDQRA